MDSLMELSDSVAVAQARAGDSGAFRVLVERHSRNLFRLAYRMTGHQQDAEDVVQETFLRAYRQLSKFDERASFGTWLYRIAANCSLDLIRARKRRSEHQEPAPEEGAPDPGAADDPVHCRLPQDGPSCRCHPPLTESVVAGPETRGIRTVPPAAASLPFSADANGRPGGIAGNSAGRAAADTRWHAPGPLGPGEPRGLPARA